MRKYLHWAKWFLLKLSAGGDLGKDEEGAKFRRVQHDTLGCCSRKCDLVTLYTHSAISHKVMKMDQRLSEKTPAGTLACGRTRCNRFSVSREDTTGLVEEHRFAINVTNLGAVLVHIVQFVHVNSFHAF